MTQSRLSALRFSAATVPLRVRLVVGFVAAMSIVLSAAGGFVYWRVGVALDAGLDRTLHEQMAEVRGFTDRDGHLGSEPAANASAAARSYQLVDATGVVLAAGGDVGDRPVLSARDARVALDHPFQRDIGRLVPISSRPLRVLAAAKGANIVVVAVRRDQRDEALRELVAQLGLAGLGALLVAAVVGERLAKAALAPVERYRRQAEAIAGGAIGVRLDVPANRDDEVTRLGHTFNRVLGALERAAESERHFVQAASHELRTPLTTLSGRVQLARRHHRTTQEYERALAEIETDIRDLIVLAEDRPRRGRDRPRWWPHHRPGFRTNGIRALPARRRRDRAPRLGTRARDRRSSHRPLRR